MRVVFLGSGAFGLPTLQTLAQEHQVLAVISQPDKPAGRGMKLTPTPIAEWAAQHLPNTPLFKPADINEPTLRDQLRALGADAWVVIAFGQKLSEPLLDGIFAINLHASLLPRWRGAAPINAAILAGDVETGNSVITLAQRMDAGLILGASTRPIEPTQSAGELHDLLSSDGPALVLEVLNRKSTGTLAPQAQDESKVTKARKLSKADGAIDFTQPALALRHRVNGLTPWPGVTVTYTPVDGISTIPLQVKLLRVLEQSSNHPGPAGTLIDHKRGLIACSAGTALRILELQPAGGKPMAWDAFARGRAVKAGATFSTATA